MAEYRRFYDNCRARIVNAIHQQDSALLKEEIAFCTNWGEPLSSMAAVAQAALPLISDQSAATVAAANKKAAKAAPEQTELLSSPPAVAGGWVPPTRRR